MKLCCRFKEHCDVLGLMKTETEHMQHLLRKTKVKIQRDFEEQWIATHGSGVRRERPRTPVGDLGKAGMTSLGDAGGLSLGARGLSPRSAWQTPKIPTFLSSSWEKEEGVRSPPQIQASKDYKSHLKRHREAIATQFSLQQKQQQQLHHSGALGSGEESGSGGRRSREAGFYTAARTANDSNNLSPSSLSTLQPMCTGTQSPTAREDQPGGGEGGDKVYNMPKLKLRTSNSSDGRGR